MHSDEIPEFRKRLQGAAIKGIPLEMEMRFRDSKGNYRWHLNIASPVFNDDGDIIMWVSSTTDIERMKEEEQRKTDFIGMVSHELRTPLTSLNAYLQVLQKKVMTMDDILSSNLLNKSVIQVKKMTTMISSFLNVSHLESGKMHIEKQRFNLAELIKEIEEECRDTILSHQVIFTPIEETYVDADRDKIGYIIINFISNAVKYSNPDTTIQVACRTIDNQVIVSVKDEGLGIAPEDIDKLFLRYYRVENKQNVSGFGIGLYLCAEIIERLQGQIWVESELGKGSIFNFSLPVDTKIH
jgi:two-component system CheB/CheR fusion protein